MKRKYLFDTSAILTLLRGEHGDDTVERLLREAGTKNNGLLAQISLTELYYVTWQVAGEAKARETIINVKMLPLTVVVPDERMALAAGRFKALYRVSLADALIAATAAEYRAILVHKDPEYEAVAEHIPLLPLPYKQAK